MGESDDNRVAAILPDDPDALAAIPQRLMLQASRDGLTQLVNRNTCFELLHQTLTRAGQAMYRVKAHGDSRYRFHGDP